MGLHIHVGDQAAFASHSSPVFLHLTLASLSHVHKPVSILSPLLITPPPNTINQISHLLITSCWPSSSLKVETPLRQFSVFTKTSNPCTWPHFHQSSSSHYVYSLPWLPSYHGLSLPPALANPEPWINSCSNVQLAKPHSQVTPTVCLLHAYTQGAECYCRKIPRTSLTWQSQTCLTWLTGCLEMLKTQEFHT